MQTQNQQDPYEFITNPEKSSQRQINFGNTPQQRMLIIGVGLVFLIIVFIFLFSILNRASNAQKDKLISLAQTQTEIVRVAKIAEDQSDNLDTRAFAVNTKLTLQSDLQDTEQSLAKRGVKLKDKTLALKKDESIDKKLEEAANNNQFDETFVPLVQDKLRQYQSMAKEVYNGAASSEKPIVRQNYEDVVLLL